MVQLATHSEATHELNETLWAVEREAFLLREQNYASAVSIVSNAAQKVCEPQTVYTPVLLRRGLQVAVRTSV